MIHDEDLGRHKTWRIIYVVLFLVNIIFMPQLGGALATAGCGVLIAFLFWGQHLAVKDIQNRKE